MGFDIEWKVVPEALLEQQERDVEDMAASAADAPCSDWAYKLDALTWAAEQTGFYHRESIAGMGAMLAEMRRQGACKLASLIDWGSPSHRSEIGAEEIQEALAVLSPMPTAPPDHEYHPEFDLHFARRASEEGMDFTTARAAWAAMPWEQWEREWRDWVEFLERAARLGGGMVIS